VHAYVVEESGRITDFFSFFLTTAIEANGWRQVIACAFVNASATLRLDQGLRHMLVHAQEAGAEVFRCQEIMDVTDKFLQSLTF
jgi:hypothetical protein